MTHLTEQIPRDRFLPLPAARTEAGALRRVGLELEFAGLTETQVAQKVVAAFGGTARPGGPFEVVIDDTELGRMQVYLDTAFRKSGQVGLAHLGLEIGREVIPVEIVTEPLEPQALPRIDALREALRAAGAMGSGSGILFGFGLHLNVEVAAPRIGAIRPVLTAFALLEDWLRLSHPIDGSRRLLPFVDPYPRRFVRQLLDLAPEAEMDELMDLYLRVTPSRNRALDMLPLFRHLDEARVLRALPNAEAVSARPTWHYRLPDSRVDEADWTIAFEWNRWVLVERVAGDGPLLAQLAEEWRDHQHDRGTTRRGWCRRTEALLLAAGIVEETA